MMPYDASSRVPLVFANPSLGSPRVVTQPTQLLDIFPTVLNLANPSSPLPPYVDGFDLSPFFQRGRDSSRPPFVVVQNHDEDISMSWFAITNGTHKLVQYGTGEQVPPQLFNLAEDPHESVNLAPTLPNSVLALDSALRTQIDYPSVALDVAAYQKQQLRYWVSATPNWEQEVVKQRWKTAWNDEPVKSMRALKAYLLNDTISIQPCFGGTSRP